MKLKKGVLSVLLLFAYSIGFAHELIPHCHHDDSNRAGIIACEQKKDKNNSHSIHTFDKSDQNLYLLHNEHADHCLVDFLICVLSEIEHPLSHYSDANYPPVPDNNYKFSFNYYIANCTLNFHLDKTELNKIFFATCYYSTLHYHQSFLRGPPSLFC